MKSKLLVALIVTVGLLSVSVTLLAHHGNAAYNDKPTEFKNAKITKFNWANPHALVFFDAKDAKGNVVNFTVETAAPQALRLIGWSKESLTPGDTVTVVAYMSKNGNPAGRLNKIVLSDGTELHDTQLGGDGGNKTGYGPDAGQRNR
jgi:Family of unknown function (DUF6152)